MSLPGSLTAYMAPEDTIAAVTAVFIVGMIWLRTRMQYTKRGAGRLRLLSAGRVYFGCGVAVLVIGWFAAPALGRTLWPGALATSTSLRVIWFLATYFIFIVVHRILRSRGVAVFAPRELPLS